MAYMSPYTFMEYLRLSGQTAGAAAQVLFPTASASSTSYNPVAAWGQVTERSCKAIACRPDWNISRYSGPSGDVPLLPESILQRPFCDLLRFHDAEKAASRRILLVAPLSGHYATLIRKTVASLLPENEVFVTAWRNARDVPLEQGSFDVEDFTKYLIEFIEATGPDIHVVAICQPVPLALVAIALQARLAPSLEPRTLTLIGGPVDPDAAPTDITRFANMVPRRWIEQMLIHEVDKNYAGAGRLVYPGILQLAGFMAMKPHLHAESFSGQIARTARGDRSGDHRHNSFYDEYLAVMDMTAEFYLSTLDRIFRRREVARNHFAIEGNRVDLGSITRTPTLVIEGARDDISAPGQCAAALGLLTGLASADKSYHLAPDAGHYGIFSGKAWRNGVRTHMLDFMDSRVC